MLKVAVQQLMVIQVMLKVMEHLQIETVVMLKVVLHRL
jgi:hypothetical protein